MMRTCETCAWFSPHGATYMEANEKFWASLGKVADQGQCRVKVGRAMPQQNLMRKADTCRLHETESERNAREQLPEPAHGD